MARATTAARIRPRYPLFFGVIAGAVAGLLVGLALTATGSVPGIVGPSAAVVLGLPLSRAVLDVAALTTVGMSLLPKLLGSDRPRRVESILVLARTIAVVSSAVWLLAALVSLAFETADFNPSQPVRSHEVIGYVREVGSGQALLTVASCVLLYLIIAVLAVWRGESVSPELRITVALFALLPLPVAGHASAISVGPRDLTMVSMEAHVLAAVVWTGGLLAILALVVADRSLLADALPRFSTVATVCVFLTAATGLGNGWVELYATPGVHWYAALFGTGYGRILLLKATCLVVAGLLGAWCRLALLGDIRRHRPTAFLWWGALEVSVLGLAFGLAAVLTRAPVVGGG